MLMVLFEQESGKTDIMPAGVGYWAFLKVVVPGICRCVCPEPSPRPSITGTSKIYALKSLIVQ